MIFTIKKGSHYCNQGLYKICNLFNFQTHIEYSVIFRQSCVYTLNTTDQLDINKLFGFSLGANHHLDSVRFGWNYLDGKIILHGYWYSNGKRNNLFITRVNVEEECILGIVVESDNTTFTCKKTATGAVTKIKVYRSKKFQPGYTLWPYFGGNNTAPHDMEISMTKIK
jgi:hypothetical protein